MMKFEAVDTLFDFYVWPTNHVPTKTSMLTLGRKTTISHVPIAGIVSVPSPEITRKVGDIDVCSFSTVLLPITEISAPLLMM
jgi:hypothetical protein